MSDNDHPIDLKSISSLIPLARNGDDEARNEICKQVQDYLNLMADKQLAREIRRKVNPSDVVQQTMVNMVNGFENFRGATVEEFYGWLNQILKRQVQGNRRDLHREKRDVKREKELVTESGSSATPDQTDVQLTPSSAAIKEEKIAQFHRMLEKLSAEHAEVIRLRSLLELPFKEVAERMDRSYEATTKLWYRAMVKLQEVLEDSAEIDE